MLLIDSGAASALEPLSFQGRVDELTLERWIVQNPALLGEPLLVLGHQLAEFEEDKDRLDILALDRDGEIVLAELKVSEDFRVTDLQALAYAGAYAKRSRQDLTRTLQRHLQRLASAEAQSAAAAMPADGANGSQASAPTELPAITFEEAAAKITAFVAVDAFDDWQPSQHVRIKLVAPNFPRRVLQTVKWLGDVYSVRVEAITARLFELAPQKFSIAFERLLPLPADEDFDMTIREREDRQLKKNTSRRAAVLPLLVQAGKLQHDQKLWVTRTVLLAEDRDRYDPDSPMFQVRVHAPPGAAPKLAWRARADDPEEILWPSLVAYRVYCAALPGWDPETKSEFTTAVAPSFSLTPGGKTLEEVALEQGLWEAPEKTS